MKIPLNLKLDQDDVVLLESLQGVKQGIQGHRKGESR